jgi:hypothetical protein
MANAAILTLVLVAHRARARVRVMEYDPPATMKLGQMLVHDGRLTQAQLDDVLQSQAVGGGRLGTVLFELGLIDLDALTVYLGLELGIPIASGAMLERAKRAAVRLLTPEQAWRYKCVPLIVQDRHLIVALEDPLDLGTIEAVTRITGYRVLPRIAAEVRIYYYIERYYGIARPSRFLRFGDQPRGSMQQPAGLPAPPLPGLPPPTDNPIKSPRSSAGPVLSLQRSRRAVTEPAQLTLEADDMLEELSSDATDTADATSIKRSSREISVTDSMAAVAPPPQVWPTIDPAAAQAAIEAAVDRAAIVDALMSFATGVFDVCALLYVRDSFAFGWRAVGTEGLAGRIEYALVPLDAPSVFRQAVEAEDGQFHGPPPPSAITNYWCNKILRSRDPATVTVQVIAIGPRPVNILYGHRVGRDSPSAVELVDVAAVCDSAAEAYARLIAGAKRT